MNTENLVIGICDDDLNDLEQIRQALCKCMKILEEEHVTVKGYQSSEKLYEESKQIKFHLLFLDLEMPGENGFELAERLHVLNSEIAIIFVSNHENMVFDSFEYIPMWFVRKSSLERDLLKAVKKYVQTVRKVLIRYRAKEGMEQRWVQMGDVLFIEGSGHNLMMKMIGQEQYQIYGSLKIMEKKFSPLGFVRKLFGQCKVCERSWSQICPINRRNGIRYRKKQKKADYSVVGISSIWEEGVLK